MLVENYDCADLLLEEYREEDREACHFRSYLEGYSDIYIFFAFPQKWALWNSFSWKTSDTVVIEPPLYFNVLLLASKDLFSYCLLRITTWSLEAITALVRLLATLKISLIFMWCIEAWPVRYGAPLWNRIYIEDLYNDYLQLQFSQVHKNDMLIFLVCLLIF